MLDLVGVAVADVEPVKIWRQRVHQVGGLVEFLISNAQTAAGKMSLLAGTNGAFTNSAAVGGAGVTITGTTDTIGATLTSTGTVNITSTQTTAGTGIAVNGNIAASGQTVNMTADGYDNGASYVINGTGAVTAGALALTLANGTANKTSTVNLTDTNAVSVLGFI